MHLLRKFERGLLEEWEWLATLDLVDCPVYLVERERKVSRLRLHFPEAKDKKVNLDWMVFADRLDSLAPLD
jgi:hypothetical protein